MRATSIALLLMAMFLPASPTSASELRMWRSVALLEGIEGIVVTPGRVSFRAGPDPGSAREVASVETPVADEVLAEAEAWIEFDGEYLACARVKDGWSLRVEGESLGQAFAFDAHVPNLCRDGPAKDVSDTYDRLSTIRPTGV